MAEFMGSGRGRARRDYERGAVAPILEARAHAPQEQTLGLPMRPVWEAIGTRGLRAGVHLILEAVATPRAALPTRTQAKRRIASRRQAWVLMVAARAAIQNAMRSRRCWKRAPMRRNGKRVASRGDLLGTASGRKGCAQGRLQVRKRLRRVALSLRRVPRRSGSWRHGGIYGLGSGPRAPRLKTWRGRVRFGRVRHAPLAPMHRPPDATRVGGHLGAMAARKGALLF